MYPLLQPLLQHHAQALDRQLVLKPFTCFERVVMVSMPDTEICTCAALQTLHHPHHQVPHPGKQLHLSVQKQYSLQPCKMLFRLALTLLACSLTSACLQPTRPSCTPATKSTSKVESSTAAACQAVQQFDPCCMPAAQLNH